MRHTVIPQVADALPIVIAVVELPGTNGCRIIGDLLDCPPEVVEIGMPVALEWYDVEEGSVPCFRPPRLTLADALRSYARSRADALCLGDGDVRLTWRETDRRTNQVANALRAAGVGAR